MTSNDDWAKRVADARADLLHVPSARIGHVVEYTPSESSRDARDVLLGEPVVKLSTGDVFLAIRANFLELSPHEVELHATASRLLRIALSAAAQAGTALGVEFTRGIQIVECVLRRQLAVMGVLDER